MKIKYSDGITYLYNAIQSNPDKITYAEFVSEAIANNFYKELTISWNMWKTLIEEHNERV